MTFTFPTMIRNCPQQNFLLTKPSFLSKFQLTKNKREVQPYDCDNLQISQ